MNWPRAHLVLGMDLITARRLAVVLAASLAASSAARAQGRRPRGATAREEACREERRDEGLGTRPPRGLRLPRHSGARARPFVQRSDLAALTPAPLTARPRRRSRVLRTGPGRTLTGDAWRGTCCSVPRCTTA